jgi:hypothetical protein
VKPEPLAPVDPMELFKPGAVRIGDAGLRGEAQPQAPTRKVRRDALHPMERNSPKLKHGFRTRDLDIG